MRKMKLNIQLFAWSTEKTFSAWPNVGCAVGVSTVTRDGNKVTFNWGSRIRTCYTTYGYTLAGSSYWKLTNATTSVSPSSGGANNESKVRYVGKGKNVSVSKNTWYYTNKSWPMNKDGFADKSFTSALYTFTTTVTVTGYQAGSFLLASGCYTSDGGKTQVTDTVKVSYPAAVLTVTYDLNDGQGDATTQSVTYNTAYTTHSAPVRTGYTFTGWSGSDGNTYTADTSYTLTDYLTLTAQWSINNYYLDLNGRLSADGGTTYTSAGNITGYGTVEVAIDGTTLSGRRSDYYTQHPYGTEYAFNNVLANTGYTYEGVYSGAIADTIGTSNVSVVLQFRANKYTIAYNNKGGIGSVNPQVKVYGTNLVLTSSQPSKEGYDFLGWDTNSAGTTVVYSSGATLTTDLSSTDGDSIVLYAVWRETAPSNVRFTTSEVTGPFNISLAWTCTGLNIINYTVCYKKAGELNFTTLDCGTSTSALLSVDEETTYYIFVVARNAGGSAQSSTITLVTPADQAKIRVYNGNTWVHGKAYIYNGSTWVKAKKVYIYNGNQWKINSNN